MWKKSGSAYSYTRNIRLFRRCLSMTKGSKYSRTLTACYLAFITQAITANLAPLLFLRFHTEFGGAGYRGIFRADE